MNIISVYSPCCNTIDILSNVSDELLLDFAVYPNILNFRKINTSLSLNLSKKKNNARICRGKINILNVVNNYVEKFR